MADEPSGGTTYDQLGYDVTLTDQRSQNGAQALPGYTPDVRPDSSWPGLAASGTIRVVPDQVAQVESVLRSRAASAQSLPGWVTSGTTNVSFGPSTWHEANNLAAASKMVSDAVTTFMANTVANINQAADTLKSVHTNYTTAEQASTDTIQATNGQLG